MAIIIPANSAAADTAYSVSNSIRVNYADNPVLAFTPDSTTDREKATLSVWIKPTGARNSAAIFGFGDDYAGAKFTDNPGVSMLFKPDGKHQTWYYGGWKTDPAAWQHWMFSWDTAQASGINRGRAWRNGVEVTTNRVFSDPTQGIDTDFNLSGTAMFVGNADKSGTRREWWDGYIAEVAWIDGQQITTPGTFGEYNSDSPMIWQPKDFKDDVTFGDNGFYLEFKENGTDADASGLGADTSGNNNHFTLTNYAATDQTTDTPTNNFCTLNPLWAGGAFTEANTSLTTTATAHTAQGTFGMTAGKWYWEIKVSGVSGTFGVCENPKSPIGDLDDGYPNYIVTNGGSTTWTSWNNPTSGGNSSTFTDTAVSADDIIGVAYDADNGALYVALNNDWMNSGDPTSGASATGAIVSSITIRNGGTIMPVQGCASATSRTFHYNFGNPSYANSSDAADANGYGKFEYAPPSGYLALCTKNLGSDGG